jgi:D-alanyl-D-alanine carboxypeptidase/D-alanyl-D-alanine-endopeptidase (penicillin-binding protein 4)
MCKGFLTLILFFLVLAFESSEVFAHQHYRKIIYGREQLASEISRLLQNYQQAADIGIYVKSMKYGDTLYSQNVNQVFVPASVMKILTAETALLYLGPDYRFNTQFVTDAKSIDNGVLAGNLYLVHSGDPSLTYNDLVSLMNLLKSQQIQSVAGNVYIDDSAFDKSYGAPGWLQKDAHYCYAAPISAGIVNHNCIAFRVVPARKPGQLAHVMTSPHYYYPTLQNAVITKPRHSKGCYLKLGSYSDSISLHGCMPKGSYAWGINYVIENVLSYNQSLVKNLFKRYGVQVRGQVAAGKAQAPLLSPVVDHQSRPLHVIVTEMMKKSDNVIAGALFKKLGQLYSKQPGSWENGGIAVERILASKVGINTAGMRIVDGSGLSRYNQITPLQMMQVLDFAYHHAGTNYEFISSLPIAGVDGTLKHRMYNIARQVRAKTGSMHGVVSLAGYASSHNKEPLAFVIMVNTRGSKWTYKELEDKIATLLTEYQR